MSDDWLGDARAMDQRVRRPFTRGEVFALVLCVAIAFLFIWVRVDSGGAYYDLSLYLNAARGDYYGYYYGYWVLPFFWLLGFLPLILNHALWALLNIAAVFFAARVFGGNSVFVLISFQMLYSLIYGQIAGVLVGSLALMVWAIAHERWYLAGLGLILALTKFQVGLVPGAAIVLMAQTRWSNRLKIFVVPIFVVAISFLLYGNWVVELMNRLANDPPDASASISLWRWFGIFVMVLWLPPLLIKCSRQTRFIWLVATNALALPYFQQADLLLLLALPIGALALLGNLGYVFFIGRFTALQILAIVPLLVYGKFFVPALRTQIAKRMKKSFHAGEEANDRT